MKKKAKKFYDEIKKEGNWISFQTSTHALGGGEWSIEVYSYQGFICEYVGENGTHAPASDLWGQYHDDLDAAEKAAIKDGLVKPV